MNNRPHTTLFLVQSLDGKISSGWTENRDWDKDIATMPYMKEGMDWYYTEEKNTEYWSLITDRIALKLGAQQHKFPSCFHDHGCILWDGGRHLTVDTVEWLSTQYRDFIVIQSTNRIKAWGIDVINTREPIEAFKSLKRDFGVEKVTVQSGGTLNSVLLRAGVIDEVDIFIAPVLIGGKTTPTLVDGNDIIGECELNLIKQLSLISMENRGSFIRVRYKVNNQSKVAESLMGCI